jgi:N-acetylglucosamine-6-phosphate deacetylase
MNQHTSLPVREARRLAGCVLTPDGWRLGGITFGERILSVDGERVAQPPAGQPLILPGFVDLHVHGGGGADIMEGGAAIDTVCSLHARHGTTSLLATTITATPSDLRQALAGVARAMAQRPAGAARVLGVHLEGPFINSGNLGAQPDLGRRADLDEVVALQALAPLRVVTLAPEIAGHLDFVRELTALGIVAQCGHSGGTYEEGLQAFDAGIRGVTHLFNAMSPFHHRAPGMVGAALAHAQYAEIIPDLLHVHPGAIRTALRAIPHLYCVTDSTAAAGMPDGDYRLGTHTVTKCMGGVRLADGTLAGSTLTMDQALRNLVGIGCSVADAARRLSTNPADYLGIHDRGRLSPAACADLAVFSPELALIAVYVEGESIVLADV